MGTPAQQRAAREFLLRKVQQYDRRMLRKEYLEFLERFPGTEYFYGRRRLLRPSQHTHHRVTIKQLLRSIPEKFEDPKPKRKSTPKQLEALAKARVAKKLSKWLYHKQKTDKQWIKLLSRDEYTADAALIGGTVAPEDVICMGQWRP